VRTPQGRLTIAGLSQSEISIRAGDQSEPDGPLQDWRAHEICRKMDLRQRWYGRAIAHGCLL